MSTLPMDILEEILIRLPTKALTRCKCLNKFFHSYISSPKFNHLHVHKSLVSGTNALLILSSARRNGKRYLCSLDLDSPESPPRCLLLPKPFCGKHNSFNLVGSCHGLICLKNSSFFMMGNPSTGKVRSDIPVVKRCPTQNTFLFMSFGFGYDGTNHDYKIVMVEYYYDYNNILYHPSIIFDLANANYTRTVKVYSQRFNSWRCVEKTHHSTSKHSDYFRRTINGVVTNNSSLLHWVWWGGATKETNRIQCFNLVNEQWADDVPLPTINETTRVLNLGVIDGCLCLSMGETYYGKYEVWMMKEYGVKESWMKLYIGNPSCEYDPYIPLLGYGGEILVIKDWPNNRLGTDDTCEWYNIRDQTTKKLKINGAPRYIKVLSLCQGSVVNLE